MTPGPYAPFVLGTRLLGLLLLGATAHLAWHFSLVWLVPALYSFVSLLRVPRVRLVVELAAVAAVCSFFVSHLAALTILALVVTLLAPESDELPANGLDRFFLIQQYPGTPVNSHVFLDVKEPLDRSLLLKAAQRLMEEIPLFRSFVRESFLGIERFTAKRPWVSPESVVHWLDHPVEERTREILDRPMDLEREPPFRILHAPRAEGGFRLVLTIHHAAADGTGQFVFVDRFSARYNALRAGSSEPLPEEPRTKRLRELLEDKGYAWALRMARRHVRPMDKVGVQNASLLDDEAPRPFSLNHQHGLIDPALWQKTQEKAKASGGTANDLLLAASLRATVAWRRERQKPDRPVRVLLPADLRPLLGLEPGFQNFVGVVRADFTLEEIARDDLVAQVTQKVKAGRELEEALESPFNLGLLSDYLPPRLFRSELKKFDEDPRSFFFSYLFSHVKIPRKGIRLPEGVTIERFWGRGSLARQPGFGVIVMVFLDQAQLIFEFISPQASQEGAQGYRRLFLDELARLVA